MGLFSSKSSSSSTTNNITQDNKRTVTGDAVNIEGSGNTIQRADASVLHSTASLLSDISWDNAETVRAGLDLARELGVNTQGAAAQLGDKFIAGSNAAVANLQAGQTQTLRTLTDAYKNAKTADAEQVNKLAEKSLLAVGGLALLGLLSLAFVSKRK